MLPGANSVSVRNVPAKFLIAKKRRAKEGDWVEDTHYVFNYSAKALKVLKLEVSMWQRSAFSSFTSSGIQLEVLITEARVVARSCIEYICNEAASFYYL